MRREEIFIPWLGKSTNQYINNKSGNWIYQAEKKKAEKAALTASLNRVELFNGPVLIGLFPKLGPRRRNFDPSNQSMSSKIVEDILVRSGVLTDDSAEYVKGVLLGEPKRAADGIEGILVVVQQVDGGSPPMQSALALATSEAP